MHKTAANVEEIFLAALEIDGPEARSSYLDEVCGDPELRRHVEHLLALDAQAGGFLEPTASAPTLLVEPPSFMKGPGTIIGPYRLMEAIGEGGMGVVYVAEQLEPVRRRVALKVIKPGMDSKQVVARFEAERQALALMDHPNIARVLDAGTTASGQPFFVMELVRGIPITEYCDEERLSIRDRLELFVLVCRAVQHAHQKGIIHRDLKPSNILVTVIDGVAVPKVIDFGVAKATGATLTERTVYTGFHQFVGTPLYMSPEQATLSGVDVDTRSDIYSLGVLLYELLTGTTPLDRQAAHAAAFDELRRRIREEEPPRPSTRLSTLGDERRSSVSAGRRSDPRHLGRSLRGELDWIVMKALEKDRKRRYESVGALAADVMRYLTDQPVEAARPSARYRIGKFVRRNRAALTTAALLAVALIAGTAASTWQALRAREAALVAQARADETQAVLDFLTDDLFGAGDRIDAHGHNVTLSELLARAEEALPRRFAGQPLVEARCRLALFGAYTNLGRSDEGRPHLERAIALRIESLGPEHPLVLEAQDQLVTILPLEDGERLARHLYEVRRRVLGPNHADTLRSAAALAGRIQKLGRLAEARALLEPVHATQRRILGENHEDTVKTLQFLAVVAYWQGELPRAEALMRQVVAVRMRWLGPNDTTTNGALKDLGKILMKQGRHAEAVPVLMQCVEFGLRFWGPEHINVSDPVGTLLEALREGGNPAMARDVCERLLREVLARPVDPDPYQRHRRSVRLASLVLLVMARLPDSVPFDEALAVRAAEEAVALDGTWDDVWCVLAVMYCRTGRLDEAMAAVQSSMDRPGREGGDGSDWLILALIHARRGELDQARDWYARGVAWYEEHEDLWQPHFEFIRDQAAALLGVAPPGDAVP